jgi:hypothetical protein
MLNQKHRHQVKQAIHQTEKIGEVGVIESSGAEVTIEQIRKPHPETKLRKWDVKTLQEYITNSRERRERRAESARENQERWRIYFIDLITGLERNPDSLKSKEFRRDRISRLQPSRLLAKQS